MTINDVIKNRRSIYPKEYTGEKVPDSVIKNALEMANWAPNHRKTEPWRFKVFTDGGVFRLMQFMADLYVKTTPSKDFNSSKPEKMAQNALKISHAIAIVVRYSGEDILPNWEEQAAVSMAVQNLWLSLAAEPNVGGYWSTPKLIEKPEMEQFLHLGEDERCLGFYYVGSVKSGKDKPATRGALEEKLEWINK
jgi:nitroreductase